jgi:hypothetical protein
MTTPDYTQKMTELRARVGQYAKLPMQTQSGIFASVVPKINTQSPLFYIAPPIIIMIIILFMKPDFVCTENIDIDNVITKKLKYDKIFMYGLISGGIISVGLFAYFRQKRLV